MALSGLVVTWKRASPAVWDFAGFAPCEGGPALSGSGRVARAGANFPASVIGGNRVGDTRTIEVAHPWAQAIRLKNQLRGLDSNQ